MTPSSPFIASSKASSQIFVPNRKGNTSTFDRYRCAIDVPMSGNRSLNRELTVEYYTLSTSHKEFKKDNNTIPLDVQFTRIFYFYEDSKTIISTMKQTSYWQPTYIYPNQLRLLLCFLNPETYQITKLPHPVK